MIRTLIRVLWLGLVRDRISLGLAFVLPIIFFTIFASIFTSMGEGGGLSGDDPLRVIPVDEDNTAISARFLRAFDALDEIELVDASVATDDAQSATRETLAQAVLDGEADGVVIVPGGFGSTFGDFGGGMVGLELIYDPTNPMAEFALRGLAQGVALSAAPDVLIEKGMEELQLLGGSEAMLTPAQRKAIDALRVLVSSAFDEAARAPDDGANDDAAGQHHATTGETTNSESFEMSMVFPVAGRSARELVVNQATAQASATPMAPYYAAGIGVMFLLFSMAGAAGSMLKEVETGALERVLSSNVTMTGLLASKWLFYATVGFVQLFIMFAWGSIFFGIALWDVVTLVTFAIATGVTALAASGFGMMLATMCRSRGQLDGISAIVILMMSAVGGSMVPRFLMPDFMQSLSAFTFNGQALDAFLSIFWRAGSEATLVGVMGAIALPTSILLIMGVVFFGMSRFFARRWDAA